MKKSTLILFSVIFAGIISCKKAERSSSVEELANKEATWKHLESIQKIADDNKNHRSVGSPGGIATANYIIGQLKLLGLNPSKLPFETEGKNHKKINGQNIIVDIPGKSSDIVMFGAHYDSVEMGPGINDNATGVAILLELASALQKKGSQLEKTIRIAFWDAEEEGVLGSAYYTKHLSDADKKRITNYINVDMVGTKQPDILVLDGNGSSFKQMREDFKKSGLPDKEIDAMISDLKKDIPKPKEGAAELEKMVEDYLNNKKIKYKDDLITSISTDTFPFLQISPTTGIAMTHDIMQDDKSLLFAPCYHQPCDNINNVDKNSFYIALGLITYLADKLAFSTPAVKK